MINTCVLIVDMIAEFRKTDKMLDILLLPIRVTFNKF